MNQRNFMIALLSLVFLSMVFNPSFIVLGNGPTQYGKLPITDVADDVNKYNTTLDVIGDFYDEIDIKILYRNDTDLVFECYGNINNTAGFQYYVTIKGSWIYTLVAGYNGPSSVELRYNNGSHTLYWNGAAWTTTVYTTLPFSTIGGALIFEDLFNVITGIDGFRVSTLYHDGTYFYVDEAEGSPGVPGFPWLLIGFGLVLVLGFAFLKRENILS